MCHSPVPILPQVPSSAYSICKVLQKKVRTHLRDKEIKVRLCMGAARCEPLSPLFQVLILHNNELRSIVPKGCDIGTLATLKVIQISGKGFKCLL